MKPKEERTNQKRLPHGQIEIKRLLRWGTDHATIGSAIPKIDLENWVLEVSGEVENSVRLGWNDVLKLPKVESVSDFHCVEGWSVLGCRWEGIAFRQLAKIVKPRRNAKFVTFECEDGYTTSLSLDELAGDDVLLAYKLEGKLLEAELGAPLRLVVPSRYAYKSAMWIRKIKFTSMKEKGYWESRGYSDTADVWKNDRFSKSNAK